jgi:CubicO group peptidase (beta-lactamase class C family)
MTEEAEMTPSALMRTTSPLRRVATLLIAAMVLAGLALGTPASAAVPEGADQEIAEAVESAAAAFDIPGMAYVVVADGQIVAQGGTGQVSVSVGEPVDAGTVFRVGSVSKPMTALAVLILVERGLVDLDAAIDEYVDVDLPGSSPVTVRSLLTHTAGFDTMSIGLVSQTGEEVLPLAEYLPRNVPTRFEEAGVVHSYSNYGFALLGRLVEEVTDERFEDAIDSLLFDPLAMPDTSFALALPPTMATGHSGVAGARVEQVEVFLHPYPAGGAVTTADDMAALLFAMLGERPDVVAPAVADLFSATGFRVHSDVPGRTIGGLEEMAVDGTRVVGHSGDIAGFGAQVALVPDHDIGMFFVGNAEDFALNRVLIDDIVRALITPEPIEEPLLIDLPDEDLAAFAGSYRWTRYSRNGVEKLLAIFPSSNFTVTTPGDGTLVLEIGGAASQWVYRPTSELVFAKVAGDPVVAGGIYIDPGERIGFTRTDGDIRYITFTQSTIAGERTPGLLMGPAQLLLAAALVGIFVTTLLGWGIAALRRRRQGPTSPLETRIRRAVPTVIALDVLGLGLTVMGLLGPVPFGLPPIAVIGIIVVTVGSVLVLGFIPGAAVATKRRLLSSPERWSLTLLAIANLVFQ